MLVSVQSVSDISGISAQEAQPHVGFRDSAAQSAAAAAVANDVTEISDEADVVTISSTDAANLFPPTPLSTQCVHAFGNDGITGAGDSGFGMGAFLDPELGGEKSPPRAAGPDGSLRRGSILSHFFDWHTSHMFDSNEVCIPCRSGFSVRHIGSGIEFRLERVRSGP